MKKYSFVLLWELKTPLKRDLIPKKEDGGNGKRTTMYDKNKREEVKKHVERYIDDPEEHPDLKILCEGCNKKFSMQECCGNCPKFELYLELAYYRWCSAWLPGTY